MKRPAYGVCLPCQVQRVIDGDTIEVTLLGGLVWRLRLIDCWCPETRGAERERGLAAREAAERALAQATAPAVFVPADAAIAEAQQGEPINLLRFCTFDRVPAYLFLNPHETPNEYLVLCGHAAKAKPPRRREEA